MNVTLGPADRAHLARPRHRVRHRRHGRRRPDSLIAAIDLAAELARHRPLGGGRGRPHAAPRLGVNIDHVATVRQARGGAEPDPVCAAVAGRAAAAPTASPSTCARTAGTSRTATCALLRETRAACRLNLEMAASTPRSSPRPATSGPTRPTLVPERREELTTEGGLDVVGHERRASPRPSRALATAGIEVSLFIDPDPAQIEAPRHSARRPSSCTPAATPRRAAGRAGRELDAPAPRGRRVRAARPARPRRPRPELRNVRPVAAHRRRWPS